MKRTLILSSLESSDLIKATNKIVNLINGKGKISVFSPVFFNLSKNKKDFFLGLLGIAEALEEENLPFVGTEDHQIILGRVKTTMNVDSIIVVNEIIVSTQESYFENQIKPKLDTLSEYYTSEDAEEKFDTIEEAVRYILGE